MFLVRRNQLRIIYYNICDFDGVKIEKAFNVKAISCSLWCVRFWAILPGYWRLSCKRHLRPFGRIIMTSIPKYKNNLVLLFSIEPVVCSFVSFLNKIRLCLIFLQKRGKEKKKERVEIALNEREIGLLLALPTDMNILYVLAYLKGRRRAHGKCPLALW